MTGLDRLEFFSGKLSGVGYFELIQSFSDSFLADMHNSYDLANSSLETMVTSSN
jgi:hypothetical protein